MGIAESLFGGDPKQYVHSGYELTQKLVSTFSLQGWDDGRPSLSDTDQRYLDEMLEDFREGSNADAKRKGCESLSYHPEYWGYIERALIDCALRIEAIDQADSEPWKSTLSTYLKAWASGLNPWSMLNIAEILFDQKEHALAGQALKICSLFRRYWEARPAKEKEFGLLSYVTIRVYVPRYGARDLMDVSESRSTEKLTADVSALRAKHS